MCQMIWQIFRTCLKIGAPAPGLRGRLGMRGISLVANCRRCNKTLTLGVQARLCKERPICPKMYTATTLKKTNKLSSRVPAPFQPSWAIPSPCNDEECGWSGLSITPHDCICTAGRSRWIWCSGGYRNLWKLHLLLQEPNFPFYALLKDLLKSKMEIEKNH